MGESLGRLLSEGTEEPTQECDTERAAAACEDFSARLARSRTFHLVVTVVAAMAVSAGGTGDDTVDEYGAVFCVITSLLHLFVPRHAARIGGVTMMVFSAPQLVSSLVSDDATLAVTTQQLLRCVRGNGLLHACLGAWLGSQPSERLRLRAKLLVAAVVAGSNEATFVILARRGHGELLDRHYAFQLPFLGAWVLALGITRAAERRARMVRAHEKELSTRQQEVTTLEQRLGAVEGEKQHLEGERRLFTRALYNKFLRDSTSGSRGGSQRGDGSQRPQGRAAPATRGFGERQRRGPSPLREPE